MPLKVQTVLGDVSPSALGRTLTHEHLAMDYSHFYSHPPPQLKSALDHKISLNQVGYLRQWPYSSSYNLVLNDKDAKAAVKNDVGYYKKFGGGTIAENTTEGLKRDLAFYKEVSKETGVHIVQGTGFYLAQTQGQQVLGSSQEQHYQHMVDELTVGCVEDKTVKAGFIGEVASIWPLQDFERTSILAAGLAQETVGCGVSFHPHRVQEAPFEIIRLYLEAGGRADKAVMSHLDRTIFKTDVLLDFAALGVYCQYDLFGTEVSYYQLCESIDMPSDAQRLDMMKLLVEEGFEDRLLMSHDIHTKHRLSDFGGHGYSHIINNVFPKMKIKGFSQQVIDKITIDNPAKWLAF
ncbi:phosphotriesterase-related protein [Plutella xylostella]|uniref:phosphotriesterase-related protein n=1 Tax=Plutella xylostella TaxID=51655 RepID=UPI002032F336|nr:phosphotriesterase-related protein [Plutella xylostella]